MVNARLSPLCVPAQQRHLEGAMDHLRVVELTDGKKAESVTRDSVGSGRRCKNAESRGVRRGDEVKHFVPEL